MRKVACVIPARISNQYAAEGDLSPFGDLSLLDWKLSQVKSVFSEKDIYISSSSDKIGEIARKSGVNWLQKKSDDVSEIFATFEKITADDVMITPVTSPFVFPATYEKMLTAYSTLPKQYSGMVAGLELREYFFFKGKPVNFSGHVSREKIDPMFKVSNGMYLNTKSFFVSTKRYMSDEPSLFAVDSFQGLEIRNMDNYKVAIEMMSEYFKRSLA